jgi:hypothetical protein
MSYDVYLTDKETGDVLHLDQPHFMRGGIYNVDGTTELYLNITYNYGKTLRAKLDPKGIFALHGLSALQSIPMLDDAILSLENNVIEDYWQPTEGNVRRALLYLKEMASIRPDGIWIVC